MENVKYLYKDTFAVIGKAAQGSAVDSHLWIVPLWDNANAHFSEIADVIRKDENGAPLGVWGIMNDIDETNKRWNENGKYMAGCEADVDVTVPDGWTKWIVPAQTYLVANCMMDNTYCEIFDKITSAPNIEIVGAIHERYYDPENPDAVELYFPISEGMIFCQSCSMPLTKPEDFGTEADGSQSRDYCCHCYGNGAFFKEETMEEMIETCIPFCRDRYENDDAARAQMMSFFPNLKRWRKDE